MRTTFLVSLLLAIVVVSMPSATAAQIGVSITIAPPVLPVYEQPICPAPNNIWTPGYWAYGPDGYFWVPGTWVEAPQVGFLWTPGYWGWGEGAYLWHGGYWGPHIGFYGGVNYGFGYGGVGYAGGEWRNGGFFYNQSVNRVNVTVIHNVYNKTVIVNNSSHVSFNGGTGGIQARPTAAEEVAARDHHIEATAVQTQHEHMASTNHELLASVNHGKPAIAATARPNEFSGKGVVAARAAGPAPRAAATTKTDRPPAASTTHPATTPHPAATTHTDRPPAASTTHPATTEHPAATTRTDRPPAASTTHPAATEHPATTTHNAPAPKPQAEHAPAAHTQSAPKSQPQHQAAPKAESKPPAHEEKPH
jgi:hypothetical protein